MSSILHFLFDLHCDFIHISKLEQMPDTVPSSLLVQDFIEVINFRRIDHHRGDFDRSRSFSGRYIHVQSLIKKIRGPLGVPGDVSRKNLHFFETKFIGIPNHLPGSSDVRIPIIESGCRWGPFTFLKLSSGISFEKKNEFRNCSSANRRVLVTLLGHVVVEDADRFIQTDHHISRKKFGFENSKLLVFFHYFEVVITPKIP